jgi:hypothetical protein
MRAPRFPKLTSDEGGDGVQRGEGTLLSSIASFFSSHDAESPLYTELDAARGLRRLSTGLAMRIGRRLIGS